MHSIVLIAHDIRSTHNVGALLRTAECMGVEHVYLTGYTPYPPTGGDTRLPYIAEKLGRQIHKTALGAETLVSWSHHEAAADVFAELRRDGYEIAALEQTAGSVDISSRTPSDKIAILLGREVEGVDEALLQQCDVTLEIPQFGQKESLNVVQAAAIVLYWARFTVK